MGYARHLRRLRPLYSTESLPAATLFLDGQERWTAPGGAVLLKTPPSQLPLSPYPSQPQVGGGSAGG